MLKSIPVFPNSKPLEISDKLEIESFTQKFPPYSDYNFTSMWSYDTEHTVELSQLNDNLIIKFPDYITNQMFYTFLGTSSVVETTNILLSTAANTSMQKTLKLIPGVVITHLSKTQHKFFIEESMDDHDYILSVPELIELKGNKYGPKRNFTHRFQQLYAEKVQVISLNLEEKEIQEQIIQLFYKWEQNSGKSRSGTQRELSAIHKLFSGLPTLELEAIGIYVDKKLIAFSIDEILHNHYGIIHFEKADTNYTGIFQFLKHQTARNLGDKSCKLINYEQDLGIEGLRRTKLSWHPVTFLKKYNISNGST